jgi:hypothetical protein
MIANLSRPQLAALRAAGPVAEWQHLPESHPLARLKGRHAVFAQASTVNVLIRLGLAEKAEGAVSELTGRPWTVITALTPEGEKVAASINAAA